MTKANYFSALEFGAISPDSGDKKVWDFKTGQTAYDWFMCARYLNDLLGYQKMLDNFNLVKEKANTGFTEQFAILESIYQQYVHHQADDLGLNFDKWLALSVVGNRDARFYELGSTLMGCIEGIALVNECLTRQREAGLDMQQINWIGVDNSEFLNLVAMQLHPNHRLTLYSDFKQQPVATDVFFAKGVSLLYAIDSVKDFQHILKHSRLSLFDYSFSNGGAFTTTIGTGKQVNYFPKEAFLDVMPEGHCGFYREDKFKQNGDTCYYELLIGEKSLVEQFVIRQQQVLASLAQHLDEEKVSLFSRIELKNIAWQPL